MTRRFSGKKIYRLGASVKITLLCRVIHYCTHRRHFWPGPITADLVREHALTVGQIKKQSCPSCSRDIGVPEMIRRLVEFGWMLNGPGGRRAAEAIPRAYAERGSLTCRQEDYLRMLDTQLTLAGAAANASAARPPRSAPTPSRRRSRSQASG